MQPTLVDPSLRSLIHPTELPRLIENSKSRGTGPLVGWVKRSGPTKNAHLPNRNLDAGHIHFIVQPLLKFFWRCGFEE
jgi:hypothetical protein